MNTYAITDILLKQNILMLSKFNNINKERVVKWFLKNVWNSTIKTEYELDKRPYLGAPGSMRGVITKGDKK